MDLDTIAIFALCTIAAGGLAYALLYPFLTGEVKGDQRLEAVAAPISRATRGAEPVQSKRMSVEETLKELERRQKNASRPSLNAMFAQAGVSWTKKGFFIRSAILGLLAAIGTLVAGGNLLWVLMAAFAAGVGLPRWILLFLKKRRINRFLEELPNAVDVIVRGVKAGLPLGDCIRIVATEAQEPVRSEFRYIIEQTALGIPLGEAVLKLFERMPVAEANFFCIVVSIQQKAGGNLSESLGNLSKVLRDRKKMKGKIAAMSQEAKSSAAIIGSLPPLVMAFVYVSTPSYIILLFNTETGNLLLAGCVFWMFCGVMVMRKMINFDF